MNIFRIAGDFSHIAAIIILLLKIWKTRSCSGISGKTQILFAVAYTARYLDIFTNYVSPYNTVMKIVFLIASYATVYLIYYKFNSTRTRDTDHDSFRIEFMIVPAILLSLVTAYVFTFIEIMWTFSIYIEAVAIMPQLYLITITGEAESITSHYLFALGSYRALYIMNWIYRYIYEDFYDTIPIVAGIIQTVLYLDFFYLYISKVLRGGTKLPV